MTEEWKAVPAWEGYYEVSTLGRVRSLDRDVIGTWKRGPQVRRMKGKILAPSFDTFGYPMVKLKCKAEECVELHRSHSLVTEAFIGPRQDGMVVAHKDGNPKNPALANLRYATMAGNHADKIAHGTYTCGEKHSRAKLDDGQVAEIKGNQFASQRLIAEKFGISQAHVSNLKNGKRWKSQPAPSMAAA